MINYDESVISYNKQAMNALKNGQQSVAVNLLGQAERILKHKQVDNLGKLLSLTYNNLGIYYKRSGDYHLALKYFTRAINQENSEAINQAGVLLNLCNLYSLLVNHPKALNSALKALELLQSVQDDSETYNFTLLTAYQSIAMEQENLSQYEISKSFYKKALNLALKKFPDSRYVAKIRQRIEVLLGKIHMFDGELLRSSRKYRRKGFSSLTPTPISSKKKVEKLRMTPLAYTSVQKKIKNFVRKLPKLKEHSLSVPKKFIRKNIFREEKNEDSRKFRVKTTLPGSRSNQDKAESPAIGQSKTPEFFPVPFKNKMIL